MLKRLILLSAITLAGLAAVHPAEARTRVFLGFNVGAPYYYAPPPYYYPPPVYYYSPPPVAYAPPAVVATPSTPRCREYRGDATIDGSNQPFYGTACLEADGQWHIVN